ncbi:MAG: HAD family hydrolase [Coriobacteriaceae bacterium]|nr:HAD family hydrolase [Coriobacteriaceae bacterium]
MIKMFASDLDGTLLNALHETDRTIRGAIKEAIAQGAHVVPATGRAVLPCGEHGFTGLAVDAVCANGSIVRGKDGEVLKTFEVDSAFTEELLRAFPQICFDCCTPDGMFSSGSFEMHQAGFANDSLMKRIIMRGMRARGSVHEEQYFDQSVSQILAHQVCKINCRVTSEELDRELKAFIAAHEDTVVNAPFDPVMFEITDKDCNKGASIAWLGRHYGIEEDEIAVYGDGGNDLVMLRRFRHSYATANGSDEAKAAASATIGRCEFHAVPKHILATLRHQRSSVRVQ